MHVSHAGHNTFIYSQTVQNDFLYSPNAHQSTVLDKFANHMKKEKLKFLKFVVEVIAAISTCPKPNIILSRKFLWCTVCLEMRRLF